MKIEFEITIDNRLVALCRKVFRVKTNVFFVAVCLFTAGLFIFSGEFDVVHTFVPDEVISSSEVNQNFRDLAERTLGTINDVDTSGADVDKVLKFNGENWYAGNDDGGIAGDCEWDTVIGGINYAGGNVGIGTTSPSSLLNVQQSGSASAVVAIVLQPSLAGGNNNQIYLGRAAGTNELGTFTYTYNSDTPQDSYLSLGLFGSSWTLNVTGGGNVGIGTTSPGSKLAVVGLPSYADDAAAGVGGLSAGDFYQTTGTGAAPLNVAGIILVKQ